MKERCAIWNDLVLAADDEPRLVTSQDIKRYHSAQRPVPTVKRPTQSQLRNACKLVSQLRFKLAKEKLSFKSLLGRKAGAELEDIVERERLHRQS